MLWAGSRCKDKNVRYVHLSMDEMEELAGKIAASSQNKQRQFSENGNLPLFYIMSRTGVGPAAFPLGVDCTPVNPLQNRVIYSTLYQRIFCCDVNVCK